MKIAIGSLIYVLGAVQSLVLIVGLNLKRPFRSDTKILLSLLLGAMFIVMVLYAIYLNNFYQLFPHLDSLASAAWMAIPPLYYLLFVSLHDDKWQLNWRHLMYFPISLLFWLEGVLTTLGVQVYIGALTSPYIEFPYLWTLLFFSLGYFFSIKTILIHRKHGAGKWKGFIWFSYAFVGILVIFSGFYAIWYETSLVLLELVLIGLFEVYVFVLVFKTFHLLPEGRFFARKKYAHKPAEQQDLSQKAHQLDHLMQEKRPYLNPTLKLGQLAEISGIAENDLSQLFTQYYQANFYEFVNRYRLEYVENLMADTRYRHLTLLALAEESGFNSKTTFYKAFKHKHDITPAQFARQLREKNAVRD